MDIFLAYQGSATVLRGESLAIFSINMLDALLDVVV